MSEETKLDPMPWRIVLKEGEVIKGRTRFAREKDCYSNAEHEFAPGEEYSQNREDYP